MKEILEKLNNKGFDAYIVGGYVRDYLLGIKSFDIDICTNANIDNIVKILGKGKVFKEYYSFHMKDNVYNYDITTFRKELEYKNNKPTRIYGVDDLYTDLLRRDFTINSIALDKDNNIIDLLNGRKDLDNKIIRCIGNTYDKFIEDKTRILRAIRFSCTLDFDLDNEIECFLNEKGYLIKELNKTYIKNELDIIFKSNPLKFFNILDKYNLKEYFDINYTTIIKTPDYYGIWAQLEHNYSLTRDEKSIVSRIKKLVSKNKIDSYDIYVNGETISKNTASIININIDKLCEELPIQSVFDIDITIEEIKQVTNIKEISDIIKNIEKNIIMGKLNNKKCDIIKFIKGDNYE